MRKKTDQGQKNLVHNAIKSKAPNQPKTHDEKKDLAKDTAVKEQKSNNIEENVPLEANAQ